VTHDGKMTLDRARRYSKLSRYVSAAHTTSYQFKDLNVPRR
jgi:hypothetical protein